MADRDPADTCPPVMSDPSLLAESDTWTHQCPRCPTITQGGRAGLIAHIAVTHPDTSPNHPSMRSRRGKQHPDG